VVERAGAPDEETADEPQREHHDNACLTNPRAPLRRGVYAILIALSAGGMIGRILAVNSVDAILIDKSAIAKEVERQKADPGRSWPAVDQAALEQAAQDKLASNALSRGQRPQPLGHDPRAGRARHLRD